MKLEHSDLDGRVGVVSKMKDRTKIAEIVVDSKILKEILSFFQLSDVCLEIYESEGGHQILCLSDTAVPLKPKSRRIGIAEMEQTGERSPIFDEVIDQIIVEQDWLKMEER